MTTKESMQEIPLRNEVVLENKIDTGMSEEMSALGPEEKQHEEPKYDWTKLIPFGGAKNPSRGGGGKGGVMTIVNSTKMEKGLYLAQG